MRVGSIPSHYFDFVVFLPCAFHRKDQKKVTKLEAQIPYHEGRGNKDEVVKIKEQIADIWEKAKLAAAMD